MNNLQKPLEKSQESFRFKYYKNYNIDEIKNEILKLEQEWLDDTSRQEMFEPHKDTMTIFLTDYSLDWQINSSYAGTIRHPESKLWKLVEPIVRDLENIHNGKVGRSILPKLKANKNISPHIDGGEYLNIVRRHHIPIITNNNVFFSIENGIINMLEGECWEINNMKLHEVINQSNQDRIHLLIDIIPNEYIGE